MIQPATLPAAGNLLLALGLPGEATAQPAVLGEFSMLLAAQLEAGTEAANSPALMTEPAVAAKTGKQTGKPDGKDLPHILAAAVRTVPLVEDHVAAGLKAMTEPNGEAQPEMPEAEQAVAALPIALPQTLAALSLLQENPVAATPHEPAVPTGAAPDALPSFTPAAMPRRRLVAQRPAPAQPQLRPFAASPAVVRGSTPPAPAVLLVASSPDPHRGMAPTPAPVLALLSLPQPILVLPAGLTFPISLPTVKATLPIRAAPLAADPVTGIPVALAPGEGAPIPTAAPASAMPLLPQPLVDDPDRTTADAPQPAPGTSVKVQAPLPVDAAVGPAAAEIPSLATPLAVPQTPAQPSPNAPLIAAQPAATPQPPHDFAALIDRLVEAREAARTSLAPATVHAAIAHADFGQISLQFQQDGGGLSVALASGDPEFARAVQAAAPAGQTSPGSDNSAQQRHEAPGQQSQSSPPRSQSSARDTGQGRHSANPGQAQRGGDRPPARSGIFA